MASLAFRPLGLNLNEVLFRDAEGVLVGKPVSDFALSVLNAQSDAEARTLLNVASGSTTLAAGSIMIQAGDLLASQTIPVNYLIQALAPADYVLEGWDLWVYPAGTLELDIRKCLLENLPMTPQNSITPNIIYRPAVNGVETASGDVEGWSSTLVTQSEALNVTVTQNTGVKWLTLLLKGNRP